jgi:hypothetical protein
LAFDGPPFTVHHPFIFSWREFPNSVYPFLTILAAELNLVQLLPEMPLRVPQTNFTVKASHPASIRFPRAVNIHQMATGVRCDDSKCLFVLLGVSTIHALRVVEIPLGPHEDILLFVDTNIRAGHRLHRVDQIFLIPHQANQIIDIAQLQVPPVFIGQQIRDILYRQIIQYKLQ